MSRSALTPIVFALVGAIAACAAIAVSAGARHRVDEAAIPGGRAKTSIVCGTRGTRSAKGARSGRAPERRAACARTRSRGTSAHEPARHFALQIP
jgi:hypothetical protein